MVGIVDWCLGRRLRLWDRSDSGSCFMRWSIIIPFGGIPFRFHSFVGYKLGLWIQKWGGGGDCTKLPSMDQLFCLYFKATSPGFRRKLYNLRLVVIQLLINRFYHHFRDLLKNLKKKRTLETIFFAVTFSESQTRKLRIFTTNPFRQSLLNLVKNSWQLLLLYWTDLRVCFSKKSEISVGCLYLMSMFQMRFMTFSLTITENIRPRWMMILF